MLQSLPEELETPIIRAYFAHGPLSIESFDFVARKLKLPRPKFNAKLTQFERMKGSFGSGILGQFHRSDDEE